MSTLLHDAVSAESQDDSAATLPRPQYSDFPENEFNYRPVPVLAVAGLIVGLISSLAIFVWLVMPLCLVGFVMSASALLMIRRSAGMYSGSLVAILGMVLSLGFLGTGVAYQVHMYQNEVPDGYERISFLKDISERKVVEMKGMQAVPPEVMALDGKKIFLKGYIYQTGKIEGLSEFLLVKDNADCCFGASPAIWDRVGVFMSNGKTIDYTAGKVAISGTFRINSKFSGRNQLEPLYIIEGERFSTRVSDF